MRWLLRVSALLALATFTFTFATGQPPKALGEKVEKKPADPADADIAAALANDPDVKVARARIQLAEAELVKARQATTLRVLTLRAAVDQHKAAFDATQARKNTIEKIHQGQATGEVLDARIAFETAKAKLATAEAELKLLTGTNAATDPAADKIWRMWAGLDDLVVAEDDKQMARLLHFQRLMQQAREAVKGPIPDRIRAALDKQVTLGAKGELITFAKALEVFKKEAGLEVPVRGDVLIARPQLDPATGKVLLDRNGKELMTPLPQIISEGETLSVGAWFQLFQDVSGGTLHVREYGLLFANKQAAPPDAQTLNEFWKQKPVPAPKPEPKQK